MTNRRLNGTFAFGGGGRAKGSRNLLQKRFIEALAKDLAKSVDGVNNALYELSPPDLPGSGKRAFYELRDNGRRLEDDTRHFADELAKGKGKEETASIYKHIGMERRDAAENIRDLGFIPQDVTKKIEKARDLLNELDKYYAD